MMLKIQIDAERIFELVNTGNATMYETLKVAESGYTINQWDAGFAKFMSLIVEENPDDAMTTAALFNDTDFLISIAISIWLARIRAGEKIAFDESTKDWSFAQLKFIVPKVSEFAKAMDEVDATDPSQPESIQQGSAPVKKRQATKVKGSGQKI